MGEKFTNSMIKEGFKISKWKSRVLYFIVGAINLTGMLNYSFVQVFNVLNDIYSFVDCKNTYIYVLSKVISYSYAIGPFISSVFMLKMLGFIASFEDNDIEESGYEYETVTEDS